jgi:mRNA interferase MazF
MVIQQYDIWLANLHPAKGTEPGKIRPVVIIQTDLLNEEHPSVIVCPVTSKVQPESDILRVHLTKHQLDQLSDILVDQIRAIDKKRLIERLGKLTATQSRKLRENLKIVLDLD